MDIAVGCPRQSACSANEYAYHTRQLMAEAYAIVREHTEVMKRSYDAGVRPVEFQVDDLVWYFCPRARPGTSQSKVEPILLGTIPGRP